MISHSTVLEIEIPLNCPTSVSKDAIITISVIPSCVCEDTLVWAGFTWLVTSISDSSFEFMGRSMSFDVVAAGIAESLNFILSLAFKSKGGITGIDVEDGDSIDTSALF